MSTQFRRVLELLASRADEQEEYLRQLGTAPSADELAIEFSDALAIEKGLLEERVRTTALALDRYLESISGQENENLWSVDALHVSREWETVRQLAADLLNLMDESDR